MFVHMIVEIMYLFDHINNSKILFFSPFFGSSFT